MGSNERLLLTRLQQPNPYVSAVLIEQEEDVSMGSHELHPNDECGFHELHPNRFDSKASKSKQ